MVFKIKHLEIALYKDKVLQLNIFHKTGIDKIISLTYIRSAIVYLIPVK